MNGFANVTMFGNLTRDPETRHFDNGSVTNFSVAVNRSWKNKVGEKQEKVSFIDCAAWGKTGEAIAQYMTKGKPIIVEGQLEQETWETDGGEKRSKIKVNVDRFHFVPDGKKEGEAGGGKAAAPRPRAVQEALPVGEDDIPF